MSEASAVGEKRPHENVETWPILADPGERGGGVAARGLSHLSSAAISAAWKQKRCSTDFHVVFFLFLILIFKRIATQKIRKQDHNVFMNVSLMEDSLRCPQAAGIC